MINIDTRLLPQVDSAELWLLVHIVKRIDMKRTCWPSNKTLCDDTGWQIDKLQRVKNSLVKKRLLVVEPRFKSSNVYRVKTSYLKVFVDVEKVEFEEIQPTGKGSTIPDEGHPQNTVEGGGQNPVTEVLSNEVLVNTSSPKGEGELFDGYTPKTEEKALRPEKTVYIRCVKAWMEARPGYQFGAIDGRKMKSIIKKIDGTLKAVWKDRGRVAWENPKYEQDHIDNSQVGSFEALIQRLPEVSNGFYASADLSVIDSKYNTIVHELQAGKRSDNFSGQTSAQRSGSRFAN